MFIDATTFRTGARGVAGVNMDDLHAITPRLVRDLLLKVINCPAMQSGSLRLSNRYPVANTTQVFQGDPALSALSLNHDAFADTVVGVPGKSVFLTRQFLESSLGRLGAFLLQLVSASSVAMTYMVDVAGLVRLAVTVHRDIDNTPVYTQKRLHLLGRWFFNLAGRQQVPLALVEPQVRLALLMLQQFFLAASTLIGQCLATS